LRMWSRALTCSADGRCITASSDTTFVK